MDSDLKDRLKNFDQVWMRVSREQKKCTRAAPPAPEKKKNGSKAVRFGNNR